MAHYGITREQTMAFGDGGNDTDMLAYAGIGVAMGNATAEPKAAATTSLTMWTTTVCAMPCCISGCYAIKTSQQFALFCPAVTGL